VRGSAGVGPGQHLHPPGLVGQLHQRRQQYADVVSRGVGAGAARSGHPGQRLAAGLQVAEQRVEAEAALEVARRALLLGVGGNQRSVEVEHDLTGGDLVARPAHELAVAPPAAPTAAPPRWRPPPARRSSRRHLAEQLGLVAQDAQVGHAIAAVGRHDHQIAEHSTGVVRRAAPPGRHHRVGLGQGKAQDVSQLGQCRAAGMVGDCVAVGLSAKRAGRLVVRFTFGCSPWTGAGTCCNASIPSQESPSSLGAAPMEGPSPKPNWWQEIGRRRHRSHLPIAIPATEPHLSSSSPPE
jgi:hypothetical protein